MPDALNTPPAAPGDPTAPPATASPHDVARDAIEAVCAHAWRRLGDDAEFVRLARAAAAAFLAATGPAPDASTIDVPIANNGSTSAREATPPVESKSSTIQPPPSRAIDPPEPRPNIAALAEALTFARPAPSSRVTLAPAPLAPPDLAELPRLADRFVARSATNVAAPELARTFANVADALRLTHAIADTIDRAEGGHEPALRLLAESLSAALVAVREHADGGEEGEDGRLQHAAYDWLLRETKAQQIYIDRHMRRDDAARPADAPDLAARLLAMRRSIDGDRARRQAWKKLEFHRKRLDDGIARGDAERIAEEWRRVAESVSALVRDHRVPPSDVGFREELASRLAALPDELDATPEFERVLRAIDDHAASRAANEDDDESDTVGRDGPVADDDVARVRAALEGRTIVLIGGQARPHTRKKLEDALGVTVVWAESREHESPFNYAAEVVRPEVAVVVLTIRWMSHAFRDVAPLCRAAGKPVVSLKAGSNPVRVARAIREQAGQRLGIDPA